jgi:hypothetical protein
MPERLLALEVRSSKFGFAVLEVPSKLLDWGVRCFSEQAGKRSLVASDRMATLLAFHRPAVVVARLRDHRAAAQYKRFLTILGAIEKEVKRNSMRFRTITEMQVRRHFDSTGEITKHAIATTLADQFPELTWKLPLPRKPYQSEAPAILVFDALANGIAFISRQTRSGFDV